MLELKNEERGIESVLEETGSYISVIRGRSMRPLLKTDRDAVVLERVGAEGLKKYDVALYRIGNKYILHRVISVDAEKKVYIIRGDNTYEPEYIPFSAILGKMTAFNRCGKHHSTDERGYRAYVSFWHFIYPVRRFFVSIRRFLGRIKRKILGKSK